jgi:hypothetical protein
MEAADIDKLIENTKQNLEKLQSTLHPGTKSIPFTKIGIYNHARLRADKYKRNIILLTGIRDAVRQGLSEEATKILLGQLN